MNTVKILIVGNTSDNHIKRFDKHIKSINQDGKVIVEFFNNNKEEKDNLCHKTYHIKNYFPSFFSKFKEGKIKSILYIINLYLSFMQVKSYDLINIHFLREDSFFLLPLYKLKSKKIMISPMGSDVYRIRNEKVKKKLQKVYNAADYVSASSKLQFRKDIQQKFSVPEHKIIDLRFGSESIDIIIKNEDITRSVAKNNLGLDDSFTIACAYNRSKAHNHLLIVDALVSAKKLLPQNTVLLFPMTYYGELDEAYISKIKQKLDNAKLPYRFFFDYLSPKEMVILEKAINLLICIQDTDANSGTLQECLLCDTHLIVGGWLAYPHFTKYGVPYLVTPSKETLKDTLKEYFTINPKISVSDRLKKDLRESAYSVVIKEWCDFYKSMKNNKLVENKCDNIDV